MSHANVELIDVPDTPKLPDLERIRREEQESLELARALMAEEAMSSYQNSLDLLRANASQMSPEDYAAFQLALMEEEERDQAAEVADLEDDQGNLSYETMLQLGERIGDVKQERWAMESDEHIGKIPVETFQGNVGPDADDSERKCLVCQCEYEKDDELRRLPCGHCFHVPCVDQWLKTKDVCPYCRVCIVTNKADS